MKEDYKKLQDKERQSICIQKSLKLLHDNPKKIKSILLNLTFDPLYANGKATESTNFTLPFNSRSFLTKIHNPVNFYVKYAPSPLP